MDTLARFTYMSAKCGCFKEFKGLALRIHEGYGHKAYNMSFICGNYNDVSKLCVRDVSTAYQ